jgi:hypothetical protein
VSDGNLARIADNFIPNADGTITTVTFYGAYLVSGKPVVGSPTPSDSFQLTYYSDNGQGLPGTIIGGPYIQDDEDVPLTVTGPEETEEEISEVATVFKYEATHAAVAVKANTKYWLEIINVLTGTSQWYWAPSLDGDLTAVVDGSPLNGYDSTDIEDGYDLAFCLNIPFSANQQQ